MGVDLPPKSEPAARIPQTIREFFDQTNSVIGVGENPLFANQPGEVVFKNMIGDEKPILYVADEQGNVKSWLTQSELVNKCGELKKPSDEVLFDMFSFMIGGRKPTLTELGVSSWGALLSEYRSQFPTELLEKVGRIFDFIDEHPKTSLTGTISNFVGLSHSEVQRFEVNRSAEGNSTVILRGDTCFNRGKLFVWHPIRNQRSLTQRCSPIREDGAVGIDNANDVQIGYQTANGAVISRLNTYVYLMARHGISEEVTAATHSDQIYMTLDEYTNHIFESDPHKRQQYQLLENENYVIRLNLKGYKELQGNRRKEIVTKLVDQASQGNLDQILVNIDLYTSQNPQ